MRVQAGLPNLSVAAFEQFRILKIDFRPELAKGQGRAAFRRSRNPTIAARGPIAGPAGIS